MPAHVEATTTQRVVEAAARLPAYGAVTGWAALHIAGGRWFQGDRRGHPVPVPLATSDLKSLRGGSGYVVSREILRPEDITRRHGLRITTALRSVAYEMRKASCDEDALVAFEMAAYDDFVSVGELAAYVESQLWVRQGVERVRRLLPDLEENSWSPTESLMRWVWTFVAGLPRPLANRPVFDLAGRFVGTPDLICPELGIFGMYDGALHLAGVQRHQDLVKQAAYLALGLEGVTMMAGDLGNHGGFVARLRQAAARAQRIPGAERRWTVEPPAWWTCTHTVALRRGLAGDERDRLLAYRRAA